MSKVITLFTLVFIFSYVSWTSIKQFLKKKDIVEVPWWSSGYDSFHSHGPGSIPGQEINIPQAMQQHHPTPRKKDAENFHTLMVGV